MVHQRRDVKSIFDEAAEMARSEDRAAYLEIACGGDADLRNRVEALLRALDEAGDLLERAPALDTAGATEDSGESPPPNSSGERAEVAGPTAWVGQPAEGPGTMIGPYKLLQQIGEGGMGAVFMAEQEKPVRRKVALKVIKPGMDTRGVIARFEAERQALAMMDHPNIAHVLDAGATETGRPFFVMELVRGVPITEYCDRNQLSPRERLELFMPVCQAIQHAHQKGIIHRDLKPSNVLVTLHDGNPVPKVIDFGVAKAIEQRLTERTLFTEFGAVIGTLEYMSPEQAEMGALDIDTRSDIYSLGVMLYELLTGSTPLERAKVRGAAYAEVLRRIREEEPTKPSTRLSESQDALPSISAQRKMEPARLKKFLRGDLDWMVMKSLEKDRTRRYETANGFARDIRRYLDGDAVDACPPSAPYKLRKFARKHRAALATVGAFATLLVAATAVSVVLALRADRERVRAVKAEGEAKGQKARAEGEKARAEEREQLAIDAVKRFGEVIRESSELKNQPGLAPLRTRLLKEPQEFFRRLRDRLQSDQQTTPDSLGRLGSASFELGLLAYEIGNLQESGRAYEQSLAIREQLARDHPEVTRFQVDVAQTHNNIGLQQDMMGRRAEALASHQRAREIRERLVRDHPTVDQFQADLAWSDQNIGFVQMEMDRLAEAEASHQRALVIRERLARKDHRRPDRCAAPRATWPGVTPTSARGADPSATEAEASHMRALAIRERLARDHPSDTAGQIELAQTLQDIGILRIDMGRMEEALASFEQAREIREQLARDRPSDTLGQIDLAWTYTNIGLVQRRMSRLAEAEASHARALAIRERLARDHPSVNYLQIDLGDSYAYLGVLQRMTSRLAEAEASHERARAAFERLARIHPSDSQIQSGLASAFHDIGILRTRMGQTEEALASYEQARSIRERMARDHPSDAQIHNDLAWTYTEIAVLWRELARPAEALASYERARVIRERLAREYPGSAEFAGDLATTLSDMAPIDLDEHRFDKARDEILQAIEWRRKLLATDPKDSESRQLLDDHLTLLIRTEVGLGRTDLAAKATRERDGLRNSDPRYAALDARLAAVLGGKQAPADEGERTQLAFRAYEKSLHASSARLYAEAIARHPKLAVDRQAQHLYNAARAAASAGLGRGADDPTPNEDAKAKWRAQALGWLRSELSAWRKLAMTGAPEDRQLVARTLDRWKKDLDLAGVREPSGLARLPESERKEWQDLWAGVDALRASVAPR